MKLKALHVYQAVKFMKKSVNFMMDNKDLGMEGLTLEFLPEISAVRAKTSTDDILIFTANIAYAIPGDAQISETMLKVRGSIRNVDTSKAVK